MASRTVRTPKSACRGAACGQDAPGVRVPLGVRERRDHLRDARAPACLVEFGERRELDALLDMARTSVNVLGNCLASAVVARWEGEFDDEKAARYLEELERHAPLIAAAARDAHAAASADLDFIRVDEALFAASPSDSIDYAVMERTDRAAVVPVSCGWSDIGSWSSLWAVAERDADGNHYEGDVMSVDTTGSLVRAADRRMIATLGVDDLVIIDTADATLVARKDRVQDVKTIVERFMVRWRWGTKW